MRTPLEYVSSPDCRARSRWPLRIGAVALLAVLFVPLPFASVRQTRSRMDAVTGSIEWQTTWFGVITTGPRIDATPLEQRLRTLGARWTRDWRFLHNTHRNILGNATCYECGTAPPIHELRPVLNEFCAAATDDELREFAQVMQSGTDTAQRDAIDAAAERGLRFLATRR